MTRNYQRDETRTTDRDNYDVKINWNRTTANQIWGKFAYMDAVVDDLTNYLGPDPNASGDGGFTKVWSFTAGQTWTITPTLLMDMTFGFARQKQDVLGPDFDAGNYGLDVLGIPGTNDQGIGDQRYAGYPQFKSAVSAQVGNRDGWNPIFRDERTYSLATNISKLKGRHDFRGGYFVNFMYLDHWQPETDNPRGAFTFNAGTTALSGGQTGNFYNHVRGVHARCCRRASNKSVQNELMTAREWQHALFFRDRWSVNREADARSRVAVGVLPDHDPRGRARPRSARSPVARCPRRRQGRQSADQRDVSRAWTTSRRAWVASIASTKRRSSAAATVSRTTRSRGRGGAWGQRLSGHDLRRRFPSADSFGYYNTLAPGDSPDCRP